MILEFDEQYLRIENNFYDNDTYAIITFENGIEAKARIENGIIDTGMRVRGIIEVTTISDDILIGVLKEWQYCNTKIDCTEVYEAIDAKVLVTKEGQVLIEAATFQPASFESVYVQPLQSFFDFTLNSLYRVTQ